MNIPRSPETLAAMCGGTLHCRGALSHRPISHICTDSREADGDTLLCAIRGERVDGHRFLPVAVRAGCRACLCERLPEGWEDLSSESPLGDAPVAAIVVEDTVASFARLAAARRDDDLAAMRTVAVTGSVGKTTTKEMIAAVLAAGCREGERFYKKDGNFNSTIGLPLSMTEIPADTAYAVLEMGMSGRGEISAMTAAARPDIAIVANIGSSHLELLGTRENIAAAKLEIIEGLRAGGTLLLNGDEPLLAPVDEAMLPEGGRIWRLSLNEAPGSELLARHIRSEAAGMTFDLHIPNEILSDLHVPAEGRHMVWAGAYAAAVGRLWGFSEDSIRAGLAAYRPAALRQGRRTVGAMTFLEDCYNAAPESMHAAFDVLDITAAHASTPTRRVAVLGSMLELGETTAECHRAVGRDFASRDPDLLITIGELGPYIAEGARAAGLSENRIRTLGAHITPDTPELTAAYPTYASELVGLLQAGDVLLFKASRAMRLESLSAALAAALTPDENQ